MTDNNVLECFRRNVPPPDPTVMRRARDRMLAADAAPGGIGQTAVRWRLAAAGAAGLMAVAAVLIGGARPGPHLPVASPDVTAAQVLERAALAAQSRPLQNGAPGDFVFVESIQVARARTNPDSTMNRLTPPSTLRQAWLSVDGRADGLIRERPQAGGDVNAFVMAGCPVDKQRSGFDCTPYPAYRDELPTSTQGMLDYIYRHAVGDRPTHQRAFDHVMELLPETYLTPAELSALYRATAQIPGVTVDLNVPDAAGRRGVAVGRTFERIRAQLIFDPLTYAFLGVREVATEDSEPPRPNEITLQFHAGEVIGASAQLRIGVVDEIGQLP